MISRKTVAAALTTLALAAPTLALAQSASTTATTTASIAADMQSQIQSLLAQIASLQQQLKVLLASSTIPAMHDVEHMMASSTASFIGGDGNHATCVMISRNIGIGSRGDDVRELQDMLAENPEDGFTASSTGVFGPLTAQAMMHFQMRMGIASSSTGFVGPMTRSFFREHCGGSDNGVGNGGMDNGHHGGLMIRVVNGTISAVSGSSISVQNHDGETITVNITASTTIMVASTSSAPVAGGIANLTTGSQVMVQGQNVGDKTVNATQIMVGSGFMPMMNSNQGEQGTAQEGSMHDIMQFINTFIPGNGRNGGGNN